MKTHSIAEKLSAIASLPPSILSRIDRADVIDWSIMVRNHGNTTILNDKAVERIDTLFAAHFES